MIGESVIYKDFVVRIAEPVQILERKEAEHEKARLFRVLKDDLLRRHLEGLETAGWRSYSVQVLSSPAGEATGTFVPPFNQEALKIILPDLARRTGADSCPETGEERQGGAGRPSSHSLAPEVIGGALFESLFNGDVGNRFYQSLGVVQESSHSPTGLRIHLRFDPTTRDIAFVNSLPWELLYCSDRGQFLCFDLDTPLVRYLDVAQPARAVPDLNGLRVLAIAASPKGLPALDLQREKANLEVACRRAGASLEILRSPTLSVLRRTLLKGNEERKPYYALHFMGHGDFNTKTEEAFLYFEDDAGQPSPVSGKVLAQALSGCRGLRLVVLNACNTARVAAKTGINPIAGVAPALVRRGVPAIVAMQLPISDQAAILFSATLYDRMAAGDPLSAAVTEGRLAITHGGGGGPRHVGPAVTVRPRAAAPPTIEWATPVLFLRSRGEAPLQPSEVPPEDLPRPWGLLPAQPILFALDRYVMQPWREIQGAGAVIDVARPGGQIEVFLYYLAAVGVAAGGWLAIRHLLDSLLLPARPTRQSPQWLRRLSLVGSRRSLHGLLWLTAGALLLAAVLSRFTFLTPSVGAVQEVEGTVHDPSLHYYLFVRALGEGNCWLQTPMPLMPDQGGRWWGEARFSGRTGQRFEVLAVAVAQPLHPEPFSRLGRYACSAIPRDAERFARLVKLDP